MHYGFRVEIQTLSKLVRKVRCLLAMLTGLRGVGGEKMGLLAKKIIRLAICRVDLARASGQR